MMKPFSYGTLVAAALLTATLCPYPRAVRADALASPKDVAATVTIHDLEVQRDGSVSGLLENSSHRLLRDVRLLVRHTWLWKSERASHRNSPGRANYYTVPDEIPAGGQVRFAYKPKPPLPARSDGHFETSVDVMSYTEVGE